MTNVLASALCTLSQFADHTQGTVYWCFLGGGHLRLSVHLLTFYLCYICKKNAGVVFKKKKINKNPFGKQTANIVLNS